MKKFFGFGFLASALASIYMFIRALSNDFSNNVGLCLTRGGQSCFETSNPVWTASTLKWLAPLIFVISVFALFVVAIIGNNGFGIAVAVGIALGIIVLATNSEIKNKLNWMAPVLKADSQSWLGIF